MLPARSGRPAAGVDAGIAQVLQRLLGVVSANPGHDADRRAP
jgi:hypothetical protein